MKRELISEEAGVTPEGIPFKHRVYRVSGKAPAPNVNPAQGPSTARKGWNFGWAAIKYWFAGRPKVSNAVLLDRVATCRDCPSKLYRARAERELKAYPQLLVLHQNGEEVGNCTHKSCGCFIHTKQVFPNKTNWATEACPMGHWPATFRGRLFRWYENWQQRRKQKKQPPKPAIKKPVAVNPALQSNVIDVYRS